MRKSGTAETLSQTMTDVCRLREAGAMAQFFAMFLPQKSSAGWFEGGEQPTPEELLEGMYNIYCRTMEECGGMVAPAGNYEELMENKRQGKLSAFLTIENGFLIQGFMERITQVYEMGVRLMTLTWNDPNCFGFCHSDDPKEMSRGLTEFGRDAVEYMQQLGMLVDVSHLSDGGFWDVAHIARRTGKPFVASHSNCRALSPATRNLTDEMIRELGECGGVAGLNFAPQFLNADQEDPVSRVSRMCAHVRHLIDKGGMACAAIGTDFDGITGNFEIADCTKMELLFEGLHQSGLSEDAIEKIAYGNAVRVIKEGMTPCQKNKFRIYS